LADSHAALAEQFDDVEQQHDAASLGMWLFLATEVMFFGGLFASYTIFRSRYDLAFIEGSHHLNVTLGSINTVILLASSFTMALAVRSAQLGRRRTLIVFLLATIVLGLAFLGIKLSGEYYRDWIEGTVPGLHWSYQSPRAPQVELFMCFYFFMTALHATHMIVGFGIMAVLIIMAARGQISAERCNPVEMAGLYWHFVDIIWIFLFPLLYLVGGRY